MRLLITGANGQLGRELVTRFNESGDHEIIATDRSFLDLSKRESIVNAITSAGPDVVVHSGAYTAVDACESDVDNAMLINALGTRYVVEAARLAGARVVYVSTDYVFDGTLNRPYDEWDLPNPQSVYGRSKLAGEHEMSSSDTIVRTSWVFGRYGSNMVKTILKAAASNPELAFVDDQHGKPTCAEDLAAMICELTMKRLSGTFHVTNQGPTTWYGFAREVLIAAGENPDRVRPIPTSELNPPRPAPRPANSVLENRALRLHGVPELADYREALERVMKELQVK